jgi:hypothetical protein
MLLCLFGIPFLGCQPATIQETVQKLSEKAYVKSVTTGNHKIDLRYVPETLYYLTYGKIDSSRKFSRAVVDSVKSSGYLKYSLMFTMTISPKNDSLAPTDFRNDVVFGSITGEENYRVILERFRSGLESRIWLEIGERKWPLRTYHMTNSWGMSKSRVFTLIFDPIEDLIPGKEGAVSVVIEDLVPGQGREKFQWNLPMSQYDFI